MASRSAWDPPANMAMINTTLTDSLALRFEENVHKHCLQYLSIAEKNSNT